MGDWARAAGGRRLRLGERGRGTWRPGLTPDKVADIVFAIASPDTLRALIDLCGWKRNAAETLIVQTLERELLGQ